MQWENVYVFISSTFNDMHAERDYLVRRVFPPLRAWCAQRRLKLLDIDLRWGISREDAEENRCVVEVCLHNVDRCRPFFLGFLGQRRGWVPSNADLNPETLEHFPGLRDYIGNTSVTELEILHAVLKPLSGGVPPVRQARIYLRDPAYLKNITDPAVRQLFEPEKKRLFRRSDAMKRFRDSLAGTVPMQSYQADWNDKAVSPELVFGGGTDLSHGRLQNFRLPNGITLEDDIAGWLKEAIAEEFPEHMAAEIPAEGLEAELFAQDTLRHQSCDGYLPRPDAEASVLGYLGGGQAHPMILHAEAGAGKTSLVAHILTTFPGETPIYRFAGTTFDSSRTKRMLESILSEMVQRSWLEEKDLSFKPDLIVQLFPYLLEKAASAAKRIDIVIDALDQLEDPEECSFWLQQSLPANVRLFVTVKETDDRSLPEYLCRTGSARPGDPFRPGFLTYRLGLMESPDEQRQIISRTLMEYLKQLDDAQTDRLLDMQGVKNPLFLHIVLMELRQHGSFETLSAKLSSDYGSTPREAFVRVLERLCEGMQELSEYGQVIAVLVFQLLRLAREALPVPFLAELLLRYVKNGEEPVFSDLAEAEGFCYVLLRGAESYLSVSGDRVSFRYDSIRQAVKALPEIEKEADLCDTLALSYLRNAEKEEDAGAMKNALYFTLRGTEEFARKMLSLPRFLRLSIRLLGAQETAELLQDSGNGAVDITALADALIQTARRLDVYPETLFMELRSVGDAEDPLIRAILEKEGEADQWQYLTEQNPEQNTSRILRQRDLSDYQQLFNLPQGILAVGYRYMTLFDPATLIPQNTVPVSGGSWSRVMDDRELYMLKRDFRKKDDGTRFCVFDCVKYDLQTLGQTGSFRITGIPEDVVPSFHAWNGKLYVMMAASDDNNKSWDVAVWNITDKKEICRKHLETITLRNTDHPDEAAFYTFLLQTPPRFYPVGRYIFFDDKEKSLLHFIDLSEERPFHEMTVPRLGNIYAAFDRDDIYTQHRETEETVIYRLNRKRGTFAIVSSVRHGFKTDDLWVSGPWVFAVDNSYFHRFDRETLQYAGSCHLPAVNGSSRCATGFAHCLPDGRIILGCGGLLHLVEEGVWIRSDPEKGKRSENLDFEKYDVFIHKKHAYHLGREITDLDLESSARSAWKRKYSPIERFDTVHIEGDMILAYSKVANTVSVVNLPEHRQVLFQKVCDEKERVLQCACFAPGSTEDHLRIWLAYTMQASRRKLSAEEYSGKLTEMDFYEVRTCLMKVDNGQVSFGSYLTLPDPARASVSRIPDIDCAFTPYRNQVFFAVSGVYLDQKQECIKICELTSGEMIYSLAMDWKHNGPGQHVYASSDHLFLAFQMNRSGGEKEELQNYLMDVDLTTADPAAGKEKPDYTSVRMHNMLHTGARRMFAADELQYISGGVLYQYDPLSGSFRIFADTRNLSFKDRLCSAVRLEGLRIAGCEGGVVLAFREDGSLLFRQRLPRETETLYADEDTGTLITVGNGSSVALWRLQNRD